MISFLVVANEDQSLFLNLLEDNEVKPAEEVFIFSYMSEESKLHIKWGIEEDYYLYLNSILIKQGDKSTEFKIEKANIIEHEDEFFGKTKIIRDSLKISVNNEIGAEGIKVFIKDALIKVFAIQYKVKT